MARTCIGSGMKKIAVVLLSALLTTVAAAQTCGVEVTYLANEGYMLRAGDTKILVDALFNHAMDPYQNHSPEMLAKLEKGEPPFGGVQVALATHQHADHFDAATVADFLKNNPKAWFVAWKPVAELALRAGAPPDRVRSSATETRESLEANGIKLDVVRLSHGQGRSADLNVGYIIHIGGKKVFHAGDAEPEAKNFERVGLSSEKIDVALVPYWYVWDHDLGLKVIHALAPKHTVLIHTPPAELAATRVQAEKILPEAVVLEKPLDHRCF